MVLTSGDKLIASGDGVGPSLGLLPSWAAKQSKHEAPVSANSVYDGYTSSDDITVWVVGLTFLSKNHSARIKHEEVFGSCKAQYLELDSLAECS